MQNSSLPQFYKAPVPLNSEIHAALTVTQAPDNLCFAAEAQTVLLTTVEFFEAARELPIIFIQAPDSRIVPLALLGLEQNENLFVDSNGNWLGQYLPAYIRRYPFITTDGAEGQITICFDELFEGFNREGGVPLFEDGKPTARMQEIQAFLQDYLVQLQQSEQFGALLAQAGLLRQIDAQAILKDGRNYTLKGMLVVDEQRLQQLPDIDIIRLFRSGMLSFIHAHLLSLRNIGSLIDRKASRPSTQETEVQKQ